MSAHQQSIEAGGTVPPATVKTVKVWDPFVRVFHWSLVALFIAAYATGEKWESAHIAIGYAIAGLLALRIIWGLVGSRHARFTDFVRGPRAVAAYLRDVVQLKAPRYLGHNPAGGAMIVALSLSLGFTCLTGYMMTMKAFWGAKWIEEVHEVFAHGTVGLIALHVLGVLASSLLHGENLVRSMFTGHKRALDRDA